MVIIYAIRSLAIYLAALGATATEICESLN